MKRTDQRRAAIFALYQHEVTGRPLDETFERGAAPFTPALAHAASYLPTRHLYAHADAVVAYGPHVAAYVRRLGARDVHVAPQSVLFQTLALFVPRYTVPWFTGVSITRLQSATVPTCEIASQ